VHTSRQLYLICHVGAASLCGDSGLRIAEPGFGSYKYMLLMASLSAIGGSAFRLRWSYAG